MFHIRKIKSIQIISGLTTDELLDFLATLAMAPKDIIKRGGVQKILESSKIVHCRVEDLDYSELLKGSGEETRDVWAYLFEEAADSRDKQAIKQCVENFASVVGNLKTKDLVEDEELHNSICKFLSCLKDEQKDKFNKCSKEMFRAVMKYKGSIEPSQVDKFKAFFKGVNEEQFADLLLEGLAKDDDFDGVSLQLFSRLTAESHQDKISESLKNKASKGIFIDNPRAAKRVKDLLSAAQNQFVSEGYRNIIASLLKDISFEKGFSFDRAQLHFNYRYMLLNLLDEDIDRDKIRLILSRLLEEWDAIAKDKDAKYLRLLCETEKKIKDRDPDAAALFDDLDKRCHEFIEPFLWEDDLSDDMFYLVDTLKNPDQGATEFMNKILTEGRPSQAALRLFLRCFPEQREEFLKQLEKKRADMEFMNRLIASLQKIEGKASLDFLVRMYSFCNDLGRVNILNAMQSMQEINPGFAISVLQEGAPLLKKEAIAILNRDAQLRKEAVHVLLAIPSPLGFRNALLLENLQLIEQAGFKEAVDYLYFLAGKRFFWNRVIRNKAQEILKKWKY
jgi:hypothetical protein